MRWWLKLHVREVAENQHVSGGGGRLRMDEMRPVRVKTWCERDDFF